MAISRESSGQDIINFLRSKNLGDLETVFEGMWHVYFCVNKTKATIVRSCGVKPLS